MVTYESVKNDNEVRTLIMEADEVLTALGYTEHCFAHVEKVATTAGNILKMLGFCNEMCENARIAGYLHDIGNVVNRDDHAQSGAILSYMILNRMGADAKTVADIITAIGNHDERTGVPVNPVSAAIILADKTDVRSERVRQTIDVSTFDIHDRVNYSVKRSDICVDSKKRVIELSLEIDTTLCPVIDYFEIYVSRMTLCRKAATVLNAEFSLIINGQKLI